MEAIAVPSLVTRAPGSRVRLPARMAGISLVFIGSSWTVCGRLFRPGSGPVQCSAERWCKGEVTAHWGTPEDAFSDRMSVPTPRPGKRPQPHRPSWPHQAAIRATGDIGRFVTGE